MIERMRIASKEHNPLQNPKLGARAVEMITSAVPLTIYGKDNLHAAHEHMKSGGLIVYQFPHTSIWDPPLLTQRALLPYLSPQRNRLEWAASAKFDEDIICQFGLPWSRYRAQVAQCYANNMRFTNRPFIQPYLLRKHRDHFRGKIEKIKGINKTSLGLLAAHIMTQGSIAAIAPEGTRNDSGGLLRGLGGAGELLRVPNTHALPVVMRGAHRIQDRNSNGFWGTRPWSHVGMLVGRPIDYEEAQSIVNTHAWPTSSKPFTATDALMVHGLDEVGWKLAPIKDGVDPLGAYACFRPS